MSILGIGVDAVDVRRFAQVTARRPRILERLFTPEERAHAHNRIHPEEQLAARFAAKEAVMKALGHGIGAMRFADIEVVTKQTAPTYAGRGAPSLRLHGPAADLAARLDANLWHISLTHTDSMAMAFVVAES